MCFMCTNSPAINAYSASHSSEVIAFHPIAYAAGREHKGREHKGMEHTGISKVREAKDGGEQLTTTKKEPYYS